MTAYAVGHLTRVDIGPGVVEYLRRIDASLAPFGGRFIIHGGSPEVKEGAWDGALIVIAFPDLAAARAWYDSPGYQAILRYRTDNAEGAVFLIEGVDADHKATDVLPRELADAR
jgi:uncharacterized protein (DUF1330 family)